MSLASSRRSTGYRPRCCAPQDSARPRRHIRSYWPEGHQSGCPVPFFRSHSTWKHDTNLPKVVRRRLVAVGVSSRVNAYTFMHRESGRELLAFHWHPHVAEKSFPHVHLEAGLELRRDLVGVHVPTGPIALEDVVRFAIEELQVWPRVQGWEAILAQTRREWTEALS